jgi:hypothetical protein
MLLTGETDGWLVGDGGLVLTTGDGGFTWTSPKGPIPDIAASEFDFRALASRGSHIWIAGAPGTCVLHSPDRGQTWRLLRTGQTAPLRGLCFIDEYRGWAVGALGAILHTRDGGQSWRAQHSDGARSALLGVFSRPQHLPLELIAMQGGSEAYLAAVEIIGRHDYQSESPQAAHSLSRQTHAAVVAACGSVADTAWRFPLPDPGVAPSAKSILDRWNIANDGQAVQRLEEHLVRRIRQWRPDVVITEEVSPRGDNPLGHLTNQVTLAAVAKAADPTAYDDQIKLAGLDAWKVKKVLSVLPAGAQGQINITPSQWTPRLGRSLAEQAEIGRGLIAGDVQVAPRNIGLGILVDHLPQDSGKRDVMSGLVLQPGSEARRMLSHPPSGDLEALSRVAQKRHNVEQLLDRIESDATVGAGWIGQVGDLTRGLSMRHAGEILWQLGRKYQQVGRSEQAAEAYQLLIEKHPQHPLADAAALWLVQYYASSEVAWRQRKASKFEVRLATVLNPEQEAAAGKPGSQSPDDASPPNVALASFGANRTAAPEHSPAERAGRAMAAANQIKQSRPILFADPKLQFSLAAAARQAGQPRTADRIFQSLISTDARGIWSQNAAAEHWLVQPNENPPKRICSVVTALSKPRLDGRLDDPMWQVAKSVSLKSSKNDDAAYPAAAVLAFDEEFLYVAVSCRKAAGVDYNVNANADNSPRKADGDLASRDRVMILLDVDRDYTSYWSLTVDHRGWPAESCFGDRTWNPQWFIAAGGNAEYWTIEAAIPLAELAPKKPQVRDVWAIGIQRVIPGLGLQSLSTPATVEPLPEGFGLMVFE